MLALHVVLDAAAPGRVLVFDEVDAGVSGGVAVAVGARLAQLSVRNQVLCVTHLPQVAAHADGHYHVAKRVASGRTHTEIVPLTGDARVNELARMLGGRQATDASRVNAAELIAEAASFGRGRGRS
jgi:DNA repair protein RecN (Recombination protein N)